MTAGPEQEARPVRKDARRNREKLIAAATELFCERGLDAPLEEVARRAGVSIGTLYNHFPVREELFDAVLPARAAVLEEIAERALAAEVPWDGFVSYLEQIVAIQAGDRAMRDVLTKRYPSARALEASCERGFAQLGTIMQRVKDAGSLRADFTVQDLVCLIWATSEVIEATSGVAPEAWRRYLRFVLDGLRAEAAHPIDVPPMSSDQVGAAMRGLGTGGRVAKAG